MDRFDTLGIETILSDRALLPPGSSEAQNHLIPIPKRITTTHNRVIECDIVVSC